MSLVRCVGCRRTFLTPEAFDLHIVRKRDASTWGSRGACGSREDLIAQHLRQRTDFVWVEASYINAYRYTKKQEFR